MKTDRFDDEFRRKLLGLPADTDPGEVDRIHTYVQTHGPSTFGSVWGKLLLVGGVGLLLMASLTYNFIQSYRNTHLQASLNSLTQPGTPTANIIKHDTVYVDRYPAGNKRKSIDSQPSLATQSPGNEPYERQLARPSERYSGSEVSERVRRNRDESQPNDPINQPNQPVRTSQPNESLAKKEGSSQSTRRLESVSPTPDFRLAVNGVENKRRRRLVAGEYTTSRTIVPTDGITAAEPVLETNRQAIALELLPSRQLGKPSTLSELISTNRPLALPSNQAVTRKTHQRWHLTLPTLSVPNAQYRLGGLVLGGDDQVGGSLLGEVAINRHWSIQAGVRVLYSQGFRYRNERDFNDHQADDFRQKYASQIPLTSDIEDINQASVIAQVPVQLAYHYPLSQQWGLRLGVGTDLDLGVSSVVSYKYQENSRSSDRGLTRLKTPAYLFNNLTITPSVEWYRRKWLFRAGPFISPQLRSVSYKPEGLSWGAHVQVFYRLGK